MQKVGLCRRIINELNQTVIDFLSGSCEQSYAPPTPCGLYFVLPEGKLLCVRGSAWPVQLVEGDIELALNGFESRFLIVGEAIPAGVKLEMPLAELAKTDSERRPLNTWRFSSEGTSKVWSKLPDWRAVDSLKYAQRGRYTHNIEIVNRTDTKRYLLDLGLVQGSASVTVNGKLVGRASLPPFIVDISAELRSGDNEIVIDVENITVR